MSIERRDFLSLVALGVPSVLTATAALAEQPQEPKTAETNPPTSARKTAIPPQEELDRWFVKSWPTLPLRATTA